ncbi:MAG: tRNA (pseudouridine(54)-N(1))-methyltransferase TrmY [Haloarculaceae archaeon]
MRQFVVVAHDASATADFPLDDLPGAGGRMDLLARSVIDALLTSHGIREDVRVHLVLQDEVTVRFDGAMLRNLHPDERAAAALIRSALATQDEAIGHQAVEPSPGLTLVRFGLEETLDELAPAGTLHRLDDKGVPAADIPIPPDPVLVLSDHRTFSDGERSLVDDRASEPLSLGPVALHANQAITVAHNWLDTDGYAHY